MRFFRVVILSILIGHDISISLKSQVNNVEPSTKQSNFSHSEKSQAVLCESVSSLQDSNPSKTKQSITPKESLNQPKQKVRTSKSRAKSIKKSTTKENDNSSIHNVVVNEYQDNSNPNEWKYLIDNIEQYSLHWKNGYAGGNYLYSNTKKSVSINDSCYDIGFISYNKRWIVFEFEILAQKLSWGNFDVSVNGNTLKLRESVLHEKVKDWAKVRIQYDKPTKTLSAYVNGRLVNQATFQGNDFDTHFDCKFHSGGGATVNVEIRKIRIQ